MRWAHATFSLEYIEIICPLENTLLHSKFKKRKEFNLYRLLDIVIPRICDWITLINPSGLASFLPSTHSAKFSSDFLCIYLLQ